MARRYARVLTSIWADPDFIALGPHSQRLYMLLCSQRDLSPCGALPYTPDRWARLSPNTTGDEIDQAAGALERARFVVIDRETLELVVRTYLVHDGGMANQKMRGAAISALDALHSDALRAAVLAEAPAELLAQIDPESNLYRLSIVDPPSIDQLHIGVPKNAETGDRRQEAGSDSRAGEAVENLAAAANLGSTKEQQAAARIYAENEARLAEIAAEPGGPPPDDFFKRVRVPPLKAEADTG